MNVIQAESVNRLDRVRGGEDMWNVYFPEWLQHGAVIPAHVAVLLRQRLADDRRIVADLYLDEGRKWHGVAEHLASELAYYEGSTVPQVMKSALDYEESRDD